MKVTMPQQENTSVLTARTYLLKTSILESKCGAIPSDTL
jgi:hypothetical protein